MTQKHVLVRGTAVGTLGLTGNGIRRDEECIHQIGDADRLGWYRGDAELFGVSGGYLYLFPFSADDAYNFHRSHRSTSFT
jgi:hypothetical protein